MPKSKSKRRTYIPPAQPRPKPSSRWVPITGTGVIVFGIALILFNYVFPFVLPGGNYVIIVGFVFMAAGLIVLSRWR